MGGGGGTPAATNEEKMLAQMADKKYDLAKELTAGSDYMTKMAQVDNTQRYEEKALADTAEIMAGRKESPLSPVTGPQDLRTNIAAALAGKAQAELDVTDKVGVLAQGNLGNVATTSNAIEAEAARKMQLEQAEREARDAAQGGLVNMLGTIGGAYATNYKRVNKAASDLFAPKLTAPANVNKANFRGTI